MNPPDPIARLNAALDGRYLIERRLGEGGMATVYLADDLKHDRKVALKVLKPELAAVVGAERFLAEIKTTANLQHPHILPLFDSGEADSFLFYVMPYVEGESLRDRLDREKQLPVDEAVRIATDVAEALDSAHQRGVIHRDIKPANILLSKGRPLVADFGIALAVNVAGGGRMTETGLSLGTPHYMSPEQATGDREPGPASDIYSLACVLYEMLVGDPPHTASSAQAVLAKILTEGPPSPTQARATTPPHVDAALRTALEKLPADRFPSAIAFAAALANPAYGKAAHGSAAEPGTPYARSGRVVGMAAVVGAILGLGGFFVGRGATPEPPVRLARFSTPAAEGITAVEACCGPGQTVSPDGEWLVYVGVGPEGAMLYRRRLSELGDEPIVGTEEASSPFFSPDGLFVGFHAEGRIRKIPLTGGASVPIAAVDRIDGGSWGDNDLIVYTTAGLEGANLWTVPAAGGEPRPVPIDSDVRRMYPWMLPGGTAALARVGTGENSVIVAVDLETGREDTLTIATRGAYASGHLVTYVDGTLMAQPFDPERRRITGAAVALLDGVDAGGPGVGKYELSREGTLVYVARAGDDEAALVIEGPGTAEVALTFEGYADRPVFSPNGRRLAVVEISDGLSGGRAIWVWDRDQQTRQLLVAGGADPVWTPDGARITFSRPEGDRWALYWVPVDGSAEAELLLAADFDARPGAWTPDGAELVFVGSSGRGNWDIGVLDRASGEIRWLTRDQETREVAPTVSPDGRWVAYESDRSGEWEIYLRALDGSGGRTQVSAGGGRGRPQWAPSGEAVYYRARDPYSLGGGALVRADLAFDGGPRVVDRVDGPRATGGGGWAVGPREGEFAFIRFGIGEGPQPRPTFVWVLGWTEIVRGVSGGA